MKLKSKKIASILTSMLLTTAFAGGIYSDMPLVIDENSKFVVCAEEPANWEADVYYVIVDETDEYTKHYQWYTTDNTGFSFNGARIKLNGKDVTDDCYFQLEKTSTPDQVYDGKNFDYEVPFNFVSSNDDTIPAKLPVKIGQKGDVNLDHKVDVRDTSEIIRDNLYFEKHKTSRLDPFGLFLGAPEKETYAYGLSTGEAATLANKLAKDALDRASGKKYENKGESEYSVSISKAAGFPGETVAVQVVVEADDSFESLDALIEWDDDTLKSAGAVSVNGTLCESYVEDGMVSIVDYSAGGIKDGAVASIEFTIPEDAKPGTGLDIYFSSIETFAVYNEGATVEESNVVNVVGATIGVLKPTSTEPDVTTTKPVQTTTTTTTTTAKATSTTKATTKVTSTTTKATTKTTSTTTKATTKATPTTTKATTKLTSTTAKTTTKTTPTTTKTTTKPTSTTTKATTKLTSTTTKAITKPTSTTTKVTAKPTSTTTKATTKTTSTTTKATTKATTTTKPLTTTIITTTEPIIVIPVEPGDANLDGKVDVRDAAYIAYKLAIGEGSMLHNLADYNRDGKKDVRDAAAIAKYLAIRYI